MSEQQSGATVLDTPEVRVARGVVLLDERVPDWRTVINVDSLDMTDGTACVVGQLARAGRLGAWPSYAAGQEFLSLSDRDTHDHGFVTGRSGEYGLHMDHEATAALRDLWIKAINRE